ncbi:HNH endonuclease [Sorangium sp. So ce394]|uniref:HNH endonuclease n=1 Tax=Sorangium sp. So ce394 TaxID=3133310 RepID=UPI003F5B45A3
MAEELRASVRERFDARCAYCGVHDDAVGATLTIDHHRPRTRGGTGDVEALERTVLDLRTALESAADEIERRQGFRRHGGSHPQQSDTDTDFSW